MGVSLDTTYLITPDLSGVDAIAHTHFLSELTQALNAKDRPGLVQLRWSVATLTALRAGCDDTLLQRLLSDIAACCRRRDVALLFNSSLHSALSSLLPATGRPAAMQAGLHLTSRDLMACVRRPGAGLLAASCHNRHQLAHAENLGVDFVTLSPVLATASHPDAASLGWQVFAALATNCRLPVYALGGLRRADLPQAQRHGAHGIAAIRALWPSAV